MTVSLRQCDEGVRLPVRVKASARRNRVVGPQQSELRVDVSAAPEKGQANQAVIRLIAQFFAVPKSSVVLVAGRANPHKQLLLLGMTRADASARIAAIDRAQES